MVKSTALAYPVYGDPNSQLSIIHYDIPPLEDSEVLVKLLAHPINPSDLNQIQGVYPIKEPFLTNDYQSKTPQAIAGMESLMEVVEIGSKVKKLNKGDWVISIKPPFGTWRNFGKANEDQFYKINKVGNQLTKTAASGIAINVVTAYELVTTIADLEKGDWLIQNASNSAVGRYVIQFAKLFGIHSINVVRDRENVKDLKKELIELGADLVLTEEENTTVETKESIKKLVNKENGIKLAINSVGGQSGNNITKKLSENGIMVTFGKMSKDPLILPAPLLIFKGIQIKGYWVAKTSLENWSKAVEKIVQLFNNGKLVENVSNKVIIDWDEETDEEILKKYQEAIKSGEKQVIVSK